MSHPNPENEVLHSGMITYVAVPYPLPTAWQEELKNHSRFHAGDTTHLTAIYKRMRSSVGVEVTRKYIPPVVRNVLKAAA